MLGRLQVYLKYCHTGQLVKRSTGWEGLNRSSWMGNKECD
jgi:hypothetical protein